jgi:hypothetical protein
MAFDRLSGLPVEVDRQAVERRPESGGEGRRKRRSVLDTRRERFSLAPQAALLRTCLPPVRPTPVVARRTIGLVGLPWLVRFAAGSPRAPREPRYPPPRTGCGCRTLRPPAGGVNAVIHESTAGLASCG